MSQIKRREVNTQRRRQEDLGRRLGNDDHGIDRFDAPDGGSAGTVSLDCQALQLFRRGLRQRRINRGVRPQPHQNSHEPDAQTTPEVQQPEAAIQQQVPTNLDRQCSDREQRRPEVGANRTFYEGHQTRLEQVEGNIENSEDEQERNPQRRGDKHRAIPSIPRKRGFHIGPALPLNRQQRIQSGQFLLRSGQPVFQVGQSFLMRARLLLALLPLRGVMMEKNRSVIRFDFLDSGVLRQSGLILDKLQMNRRMDGGRQRRRQGGFHGGRGSRLEDKVRPGAMGLRGCSPTPSRT